MLINFVQLFFWLRRISHGAVEFRLLWISLHIRLTHASNVRLTSGHIFFVSADFLLDIRSHFNRLATFSCCLFLRCSFLFFLRNGPFLRFPFDLIRHIASIIRHLRKREPLPNDLLVYMFHKYFSQDKTCTIYPQSTLACSSILCQ